MKKILLIYIIVFVYINLEGQISKENLCEIKKCEIGFLYYTDRGFPTFVPIKNQLGGIQITEFSTKTLKEGFQLNWKEVVLDSLAKYEHSYRLLNYSKAYNEGKAVILQIVPVKLCYVLLRYSKSTSQFAENTNIDKLKLEHNFIVIKSFGGIPIKIDSLIAFKLPQHSQRM